MMFWCSFCVFLIFFTTLSIYLIDIISAHHLNEITIRFWVVAAHGVLVLKSHYSKWLVTRHMSANHHEGTMDRKSWPWQVKSKVWEYSLHYCSANRAFLKFQSCRLCTLLAVSFVKKTSVINESKQKKLLWFHLAYLQY